MTHFPPWKLPLRWLADALDGDRVWHHWYGDNSATVTMRHSSDLSHEILPEGFSEMMLLLQSIPFPRNLYTRTHYKQRVQRVDCIALTIWSQLVSWRNALILESLFPFLFFPSWQDIVFISIKWIFTAFSSLSLSSSFKRGERTVSYCS